jgi:hypothetical protein
VLVASDRHAKDDPTADEIVKEALGIDETAAGLVRDLGEEANPDLVRLPDELDDELVWRTLEDLRERGA